MRRSRQSGSEIHTACDIHRTKVALSLDEVKESVTHREAEDERSVGFPSAHRSALNEDEFSPIDLKNQVKNIRSAVIVFLATLAALIMLI